MKSVNPLFGDAEAALRDSFDSDEAPDAAPARHELRVHSLSAEHMPLFLANSIQLADFRLSDDVINSPAPRAPLCDRKEIIASSNWKRQLFSLSTAICIVQVVLLIVMVQLDGFVSRKDNPFWGPPVNTLVHFGAKDAGKIVYQAQWWRLLASIMLHGGVLHIVPNVLIQLRIGGYLTLIYGWRRWTWIYFVSGTYGQILSCLFLPDTVGVGSSGALMGLLTSWAVWILFRWKKIPPAFKAERNCQMFIVIVSVVLVLASSAKHTVDWAAHAGGTIQGVLWGFILLSSELDRSATKFALRVMGAVFSLTLFIVSILYMIYLLHPPRQDYNDDY